MNNPIYHISAMEQLEFYILFHYLRHHIYNKLNLCIALTVGDIASVYKSDGYTCVIHWTAPANLPHLWRDQPM